MYLATQSSYPFGVLILVPTAVPPRAISDRWFKENFKESKPFSIKEEYPETLDLK